mmetsp:Transcript_12850/g.37709  ORF Transcript_12850/g.37709 Transcript_12850/m.37709 type:complete len:132 (+) Transcript_12850:77-472(+)
MVWQKTSGFRKHCRKRQVLRPWMPRRVPAHAAPRRRCPRHDNNQNRRCERLPTCPAKFFPRCKNGSKAAREQAEWLAGQPDDAEKSTEAERDEEQHAFSGSFASLYPAVNRISVTRSLRRLRRLRNGIFDR